MNPDTQLNHYRIVSPLGEGGMGQVYRAEDTRLKRQVAIKVLPPEVAADPERLARLEREAQLLAQLEHPNIAAVYGLEESGGTRFLVMQLVEGGTLADRIAEGPVAVASAMSIALQIAEGLEAAHERGIIHRDLKPANVMVDDGGAVKILDFGLAKAGDPSASGIGSAPELTASPTMMAPTQAGVILGTAAYMSPEQARGKAVDKRTDIWAFGCVLYETLTGRQGFGGETVTDILAAIVHKEPDLAKLPAGTPWRLREMLERCLVKDPAQRLRDVGDARIALQQAIADPSPPETLAAGPAARPSALRGALVTAAAAAVAVVLTALVMDVWRAEPATSSVRRFELNVPDLLEVRDRAPRLSPDGSRVLFYASGQLWIRDLAQLGARALPGTEEAIFPFWSPDGEQVGFFVENRLWRMPVDGGERISITTVAEVEGAFWAPDGTIYFGRDPDLARVPEIGGDPVIVVDMETQGHPSDDGGLDLHDPFLLPDGRSLLYRFHSVDNIGSIMLWDGEKSRPLLEGGAREQLSEPVYSPTGHILYSRGGAANAGIWAVAFDEGTLQVAGEPFPVAIGHAHPSLAADGSMVAVAGEGSDDFAMTWVSLGDTVAERIGASLGPLPGATLSYMEASPQADRVALVRWTGSSYDLWVIDDRGGLAKVTSHEGREWRPAWGPEGDRVVYTLTEVPAGALWEQKLDGASPPERLTAGRQARYSPDGRLLVFIRADDSDGAADIWTLDLTGGGEPKRWLETPEAESAPVLSPNGRLIAYASDASGESEIHLRNFPDGSDRRVVSTGGGRLPKFSPDGSTLYYVWDAALMSVSLEGGRLGAPVERVTSRMPGLSSLLVNAMLGYTIHPDGDQVLLPAAVGDGRGLTLVLTQNWWSQFAGDR